MAYKLMLKSDSLVPLQIEKSPIYQSIFSKMGDVGSFRLIDIFTSSFANKKELIQHLVACGIWPKDINSKSLVIVWSGNEDTKYNHKYYGLLFMDSSEQIMNPDDNLYNFFNSCVIQKDYLFFERLIAKLKKQRRSSKFGETCSSTIDLIARHINLIETYDERYGFLLYDLDTNGDTVLKRFFKLLIHQYNDNEDSTISYLPNYNWWMVHTIIEFINEYTYDKQRKNGVTRFRDRKAETGNK